MSDWFGMDVATEVATINDAIVALGLTKDEAVAEELLDEASARFRQVRLLALFAGPPTTVAPLSLQTRLHVDHDPPCAASSVSP